MTRYICPYCAPAPANHRTTAQGELVCGTCGDPLLRQKALRWRQLAAFVGIGSLIAPLLALIWVSLQRVPDARPRPAQARLAKTWIADSQAPVAS